jgi:short-subunit dehydrogenase
MTNSGGKIAAVTGASSGIGRAIAIELAHRGYNIIATGRDGPALSALAAEIDQVPGREADIIVADLAVSDDRRRLANSLAESDIEILVNNAGSGVNGMFADTLIGDEKALVEVQILAMLELTKVVLPNMRTRGSGSILNVSSVYAFAPVPQQSVYAAAKSFIYSFSSSLRNELQYSGISVTVLAPGITQTAFRKRAGIADRPNSGLSAAAVASAAVDGLLEGRALVIPGLANRLFVFLSKHLPTSMAVGLIDLINSRRGVHRSS